MLVKEKHFSPYFVLSSKTTPLPLSCFKITSCLFLRQLFITVFVRNFDLAIFITCMSKFDIQSTNDRNSRPEVFCKKVVLRNFAKFTGKHLCQSLFFNKVAGLKSPTLLKKRLWHRCFPVNFAKFLRTPFLQNTSDGCFSNDY